MRYNVSGIGLNVYDWSGLNLRLVIDNHWAVGELHHRTIQLHDDVANGGDVVDYLAPHLDVKIFKAVLTLGGHDMVTGGRQVEEISIKGLPVIVSPSCAHLADVICISYNNINILKHIFNWQKLFKNHCHFNQCAFAQLPDPRLSVCRDGMMVTILKRRKNCLHFFM